MTEPHERLRQARKDAGFETGAHAAKRFHWNENTYKSAENGTRGITPRSAKKYADAFGRTAGWILHGEISGPLDLNDNERRVLAMFRVMSDEGRLAVLSLCEALTRPRIIRESGSGPPR